MYLTSALGKTDPEAAGRIVSSLSPEVLTDWKDNNDYWERYASPSPSPPLPCTTTT
jgi:hypothetical protein